MNERGDTLGVASKISFSERAVLHDWTFFAACLGSRRRSLGIALDEWLILSGRELFCDCVWLLEIGDASTRAL